MDLVLHLRYFLVVAEELHFGRAAARLHITQPPLSQRIRRLEQEYGTQLFDRSGGRVRLTPAGDVLVNAARDIVTRVDATRSLVRQAASGQTGVLRAGIPPDTPGGVLAALSTAFAAAEPDIDLELRAATTTDQLDLLDRGALDVGLLQHPVDTGDLRLGPEVSIVQGVVLSRRSPLAERTEVALADLTGYGLVLFPREAAPGLYDETLHTCHRHGFRLTRLQHAANAEFLLGLVAGGDAVAFDHGAIAQKEPRVVWRPLTGIPLVWRMSTAWRDGPMAGAANRFGEIVAHVLDGGRGRLGPPAPAGTPKPWNVVFPERLSIP
ncbi:LysR family transcriptional regulator [Rugosimonospora africana]|uniref:LysR family transcriptional regulator n=1 Tax=Rugosimonospora africana TaxID=556532 RepID=A0A8J3VQV5_9ACTN|nr:LysR substrate-binding domain-containing protein [Rugosimonospora africana]GIH15504.1 LysR family transcriptional regulator [Rugosimonospora africana]